MAVRPSTTPYWGGTQVEPTTPQKTTGFVPNFRPPAEWHNFLFGDIYSWIAWFDYKIQAGIAALQGYDWVVGVGGTHATINALIADSNVVAGNSILVTSPQTLTVMQDITKSDLYFDFKPSAVYSKGLTLVTGIKVNADRVTIRGGRFTDWATGGDKAIQIAAGKKNNLIYGSRFANCDTGIDDLGTNSALGLNIDEV